MAGGGLQLRTLMPRPGYVHEEPEGLIVSMWTDPEHRRRGLGRSVVEAILAWGRANGVTRFTFHASEAGHPTLRVYGFAETNEMRLGLALTPLPILWSRSGQKYESGGGSTMTAQEQAHPPSAGRGPAALPASRETDQPAMPAGAGLPSPRTGDDVGARPREYRPADDIEADIRAAQRWG